MEPQARGRERITEAAIRRLSTVSDWGEQRCAFAEMVSLDRTPVLNKEKGGGE